MIFRKKLIIILFTISLNICSYSQSQIDSVSYYLKNGDFNKGIKCGETVKTYLESNGKVNTLEYAFLLDQIAYIYQNKKDFIKAKHLLNIVLKTFILINGEKNKYVAFTYEKIRNVNFYLAISYCDEKKYKEAEIIFNDILNVEKSKIEINSEEYAYMLSFKADVFQKEGKIEKAIETHKQVLELKGVDFDKCKIFSSIGMLYGTNGDFKNAFIYFDKSLGCVEKKYGKNNKDYIRNLENVAGVYSYAGDYLTSEKLYNESIELSIKNNFPYANILGNLGYVYLTAGNLNDAEKTYLKAFEIYNQAFEINNRDFLSLLYGISEYYLDVGQFDKSLIMLKKATEVKNKFTFSVDDEILYLSAWSKYYMELKNYNESEENYIRILELLKTSNSNKNYTYYSKVKSSLAFIYIEQGKYENALKIYNEAFDMVKNRLGENPRNDVSLLHGLARMYGILNNDKLADFYYTQSFNLFKNKLTEDNPIFDDLLYGAAVFYEKSNLNQKVNYYYEKSFNNYQKIIKQQIFYQSNLQFNYFIKNNIWKRFFPLSFLHRYPSQYSTINIGCYENELLVKNLSLRNQQRIAKSIQKGGDPVLQNKYEQFLDNKRQLVKLNEMSLDQRPTHYSELAADTEILEKELVRGSSVFSDAKNALSVNWKQVQEKLQSNAIAIDLVAYNYYNKKWTDSIVYAAFVVGKGYKAPKYIPLFEEKQLKYLIVRNSKDADTIQVRILNKQYLDKVISDLFLKPLEKELQGISTIYLSPSGLGNQIDFSALPVSATQTLGEKYQVHILGSTAEIVNYKTTHLDPKTKLELLLYGDIDYNKSEATSIFANDTLENKSNIKFEGLATRSGITKWNYLIGTKKEVEQIQISGQQNGFSTTIINEGKATEESIKQLDGKTTPYLLHLATHGFFFSDPKQELPKENLLSDDKSEIFKTAEDPMMRSGLLFAGANKYWGKPVQNLMTDDGILTASEISNLDLSACQLVVLSACETGLGDISGSEGVFGLQRAFKMAGVKNIIMSLWKVPDIQTAELFDVFYAECFAGKTIHEAFQTAQAKMKLKYLPYYWAGFVLLE